MILFIDTETFSEAPIKKTGAYKYAQDPTTECLIIQWAYDTGPVHYQDMTENPVLPDLLRQGLKSPAYTKVAFNVPFDKAILLHTLDIDIPWSDWKDAQTLAYSLGFTGSMAACQEAMGFSDDVAKIKAGGKLIRRFCMPQPKNHNVRRWTRETSPGRWQQFIDYGVRDVESMRMMWRQLEYYNSMSEYEWDAWRLTSAMNDRGIPVDINLVETAIHMVSERKKEIMHQMIALTGLKNPNSVKQLKPWLLEQGVAMPNMQAATVDAFIPKMHESDAKALLQLKRTYSQNAVKKWDSIKHMEVDGLVRGQFLFRGASRTGRDASRGINLQNLRRPPKGNMDDLIQLVYAGNNDVIQIYHGEPINFLAGTVRGAITAPEGYKLVVSDLSSIESRILGYLCGCTRMEEIFSEGKDTYKDYATELFNVKYEDVTKEQRTFSKPPVLGAGYMMGGKGLAAYAESMGVDMSQLKASRMSYSA